MTLGGSGARGYVPFVLRGRTAVGLFAALAMGLGCSAGEPRRDAPVVAEAPAGSDDGMPAEDDDADEPLLSWSFEPASKDCNGWPVLGDAIRAAPSRSGAYSCKVCANGSSSGLGLSRALGAVEPGRYVLTAWVRKRANTAAPPAATARMEADTSSGLVSAVASSVIVREAWDRLEVVLELTGGASSLHFTIGSPAAEAGRCLFIDDVSVARIEPRVRSDQSVDRDA